MVIEKMKKRLEQIQLDIAVTKALLADEDKIDELKKALDKVNEEQKAQFEENGSQTVDYVAHGTDVPPEEFWKDLLIKETNNELNIIKQFREKEKVRVMEEAKENSELVNANLEKLSQMIEDNDKELKALSAELRDKLSIPGRLFALRTKLDENGEVVRDDEGRPVPVAGSYAYAIKKCAASVKFMTDDKGEDVPILVGLKEEYEKFVPKEGENFKKGYVYVMEGAGFKPEYSGEKVSEYTTQTKPKEVYHIEVTPKVAMEHNAQFIMFDSQEDLDKWLVNIGKLSKKMFTDKEKVFVTEEYLKSLAEEVSKGKATYINARDSINPSIKTLEDAQKEADHSKEDGSMLPEKDVEGSTVQQEEVTKNGQQEVVEYLEKVRSMVYERDRNGTTVQQDNARKVNPESQAKTKEPFNRKFTENIPEM